MRFHQLVRDIRIRKKNLYGAAFTQKACGSRMNPPITQEGWSHYEVRDSQPDYETVRQIANALQIPEKTTDKEMGIEDFFKAAGYDLRNDLKLPVIFKHGNALPVEITTEKAQQIQELRDQMREIMDKLDKLTV